MKLILAILLIAFSSTLSAATTADFIEDAEGYIQKRDFRAAIIQLKNALQQEPTNANARLKLGEVYLMVGNGPAAEKEYRKAKKNGAAVDLWMPKLGEAMLIQGRGADVIRDIRVQEAMSNNVKADILGKRGQAYLMIKDIESAATNFDESLKLDNDNTFSLLGSARILLSQNKVESAALQVDKALENSPNNVIALTLRADLARQAGELSLAQATYEKALSVFSRHIPALAGLAATHITLSEFPEAVSLADQIIAINKEIPLSYYIKALVDINRKDIKSAESNLQRVLRIDSGHLPSLFIIGRIQYSNGNYELAEKSLGNFTQKVPKHLPAIKLLGANRLKLKDLSGAKKILEQGEALDSNDAEIISLLGMAYSQSGEISKGLEYFERAAKISPEKANIQTQLGLSYLAGGELDQAVSTLENAIKLDEDFERADVMLILAYLRKKDYDNALKVAVAFAVKQPNNPVAYSFQGVAYSGKNESLKSRQAFEKALKIKPDYSAVELNLARLDIKEKKIDSAEKRFRKVIGYEGENIGAYLGLAKLLLEKGDKEESLSWIKKINQKQPKAIQPAVVLNRFYLLEKQPVKALDVAKNIASIHPTSILVLEMLARTEVVNQKFDDALRTSEMIVKLVPANPNAYYQLALAHLRQKDEKQAKNALDKSLRLDEKHIGVLSTYANLEIKEKRYKAARVIANKLKQEYNKQAIGWMIEGDVYSQQKKYALAVKSYQSAIKKQNNNRIVHKLAKVYEASGDKEKSVLTLKNWLNENEKDVAGHMLLAQFYQNHKDGVSAAKSYEKAIALAPRNVVALNNVAWIYTEKRNKKGVDYGRRAYDLAPNNPSIADTYGWALVRLGDKQKGLMILQQASVQAPHLLDIKYHLASGYYQIGDIIQAKRVLERLLIKTENFDSRSKAEDLMVVLVGLSQ